MSTFDFEKQVVELETRLKDLSGGIGSDINLKDETDRIAVKIDRLLRQIYARLTPAQKVQVARHPERPHFKDYVAGLIRDFTPLAGDRRFSEDLALPVGIGRFRGRSCMIMGHEKGHDTTSRIAHNFGMARPEGYRKAQRAIEMAGQFQIPIITLVDTAGAYPGVGAEERGQSEAIAASIDTCLRASVPLISVIVGEGGSGGAIAIAAANRIYMLEHSIYSVISPEGCASILWRSASFSGEAATALKLTAQDLYQLKLIDGIIAEPVGGAQRNPLSMVERVGEQIDRALKELTPWSPSQIRIDRERKFLAMGRA